MSLTKDDKNWIIGAVSKIVASSEEKLRGEMNDRFDNIPTLDEFNEFKDTVLGAINKHESELSASLARLEERIEVLESSK